TVLAHGQAVNLLITPRALYAMVGLAAGLLLVLSSCGQQPEAEPPDAQAIVVGAGLSGLSAAVEMGRAGIDVLVVDMNSVAGGTAVRAGGVAIVGTPVQEAAGIHDTPELAVRDWLEWTEDGDPGWTRFYAEMSREMIFDWTTDMGVEYVRVAPGHGNSVSRFHFTEGRAIHLVLPIYKTALQLSNVSFLWNTRVESLLVENDRISGVLVKNLRSGVNRVLRAPNIVLATGGFESDLARVRANWMAGLPQPERLLIGSAPSALGSGHDMASDAGAALARLDRHYIYVNGVPDPRDADGLRALTAGNDQAMWVNAQGVRFTNEGGFDKDILIDLLHQEPSSYWAVFDESSRNQFTMRGSAWLKNQSPDHPVLDNPQLSRQAPGLKELAVATGLPATAFENTVRRYNAMIDQGEDSDFGRFSAGDAVPARIERPPFYAVQVFPMTRKNMGGVVVDRQARVLDERGNIIDGLYAVGELTGSVGINGRHGLDGMFLGPSILTGRLAGRSVAAHTAGVRRHSAATGPRKAADTAEWTAGLTSSAIGFLLTQTRDGYWHFENSHRLVLERGYECERCHSARLPFTPPVERSSLIAQTELCVNCH
ncbi:MAG: FAD-dependent oxidoreductase, partial [Gammaproteobacteria bacterium]|nr:FAD-dependent oxidoreductase [Gammaproteobacteria bacterium]